MTGSASDREVSVHSASYQDLNGKSVLITGGASGIGAALTEGFLAQGCKVAFIDLLDGAELCDRLEASYGSRPLAIQADLTDMLALRSAISAAATTNGPISILVNNAALDDRHETLDVTPDYWRAMLATNFDHVFFAAQAVIPGMQAQGGGAIINFTSISYMMGMGGMPAYTSAKAAITALTRTLAREFGADGIRVNAIAPGWVMTERQVRLWANDQTKADMIERQCVKENLVAADMVGPVLFLASNASRMIAGQVLAVDGGVITVPA
jgi:NAD(P)-dependent dehydrogenase (short-subunit alcohol dehydrogenase family)